MRMTVLLVTLLLTAPVWSQAKSAKTVPAKPAQQAPALPSQPPPGAEKNSEGYYRWKDASGEWWLYKQTPFGWSKAREKDIASVPRPEEKPVPIRVVFVSSDGDEITFEKPTPFGVSKWTNKKPQLTAGETEALDRWNSAKVAATKSASEKE